MEQKKTNKKIAQLSLGHQISSLREIYERKKEIKVPAVYKDNPQHKQMQTQTFMTKRVKPRKQKEEKEKGRKSITIKQMPKPPGADFSSLNDGLGPDV